MLQVYRDDEHASVAAPLLPINNNAQTSQPRWSKQSRSKKHLVRAAFAAGALVATYLVLCTWVAFSDNGSSLAQRGASTGFPHPKLPWPFPGRKHPHPHPHPHPHHRPHPIVLGCTAIPTPSADAVETSSAIELNVTLPAHAPVVLAETLIHGNVSVVKTVPSEGEVMMREGGDKTLLVGIKVHNRTFRHPPPPSPSSEDDDEEEEEESGPESFLLCAITFPGHPPHSPPPHPSPDMETDGQASLEHPHHPPPHGHPPFHPHHPPVIVAVLPALNETYPKFPGPHGPPHHPPPHHPPHGPPKGPEEESTTTVVASSDSVLITAWKSTISFLFPMLSIFPSTPSTFPGHHGPPCHHRPHPPPPPPPFFVTALEVSLPRWTRVVYGHGPPPPHGPWRH